MVAPTLSASTDFSAGSAGAESQFHGHTTVLKLNVMIISFLHVYQYSDTLRCFYIYKCYYGVNGNTIGF